MSCDTCFWVIWDAEFEGDITTKFDQREGQCQVKLCQIRSNFQIQNFLTKNMPIFPVLSQNPKNVIHFHVHQLEIQKMGFKKSYVIILTRFLGYFTAKNKDIALKFCMRVVSMYLDDIYSGFLNIWKILNLTRDW